MNVRELIDVLNHCNPNLPVYVQDAHVAVADKVVTVFESTYRTVNYGEWEGGDIVDDLKDGDRYVSICP